jgi:ceramide glucosyltransferase
VRWARLRRASFFAYFLPELFSGGVLPMIAFAFVADAAGLPVALSTLLFGTLWYGAEMLLAAAADWYIGAFFPVVALTRDLLLPVLFFSALRGNGFVWRGNEMQVERMQPRLAMARVRPRVHELAASGRRRLRALRARAS